MVDRLFRSWARQDGVVDQHTGNGETCEQPRSTDDKLKPASGIILGVSLGALIWALIGLVFRR